MRTPSTGRAFLAAILLASCVPTALVPTTAAAQARAPVTAPEQPPDCTPCIRSTSTLPHLGGQSLRILHGVPESGVPEEVKAAVVRMDFDGGHPTREAREALRTVAAYLKRNDTSTFTMTLSTQHPTSAWLRDANRSAADARNSFSRLGVPSSRFNIRVESRRG